MRDFAPLSQILQWNKEYDDLQRKKKKVAPQQLSDALDADMAMEYSPNQQPYIPGGSAHDFDNALDYSYFGRRGRPLPGSV